MIWRPLSLSELTPIIIDMELTKLGFEAFIYLNIDWLYYAIRTNLLKLLRFTNFTKIDLKLLKTCVKLFMFMLLAILIGL